MHSARRSLAFSLLCLSLLSAPAAADTGVPMLVLIWPASWILLLPIVLVEAAIAYRLLGLKARRSLLVSAVANTVSTLVGIPLTWAVLAAAEILATKGGRAYGLYTWPRRLLAFTVQAPWLVPYEEHLDWLIPAAAIVLCIPFFFVSVYLEYQVARRVLKEIGPERVRHWSWRANLATYGAIVMALAVMLALALRQHAHTPTGHGRLTPGSTGLAPLAG
jgi:hypothetical protein